MINCKSNIITVEVANEWVVFEFSKTLNRHMIERICRVNLVEDEIEDFEREVHTEDEFHASLIEASSLDIEEVKEFSMFLNTTLLSKICFKTLPSTRGKKGRVAPEGLRILQNAALLY